MFQTIVNLAAIIGNIAIATALFFSLRQLRASIRQAEESRIGNKLALWNTIQNQALDFYVALAQSDLAPLYAKGRNYPDSLTEDERRRFFYLCVAWFTLQEGIYAISTSNYLPKAYFTGWTKAFDEDLQDPGFKWFWQTEGHLFDELFRVRVDEVIAKSK